MLSSIVFNSAMFRNNTTIQKYILWLTGQVESLKSRILIYVLSEDKYSTRYYIFLNKEKFINI